MGQEPLQNERGALTNPRWLGLALACIGAHQVQSALEEPEELTFRLIVLAIIALLPLSLRLPSRPRGALWLLLGLPPTLGAYGAHIYPIIRDRRVPPASETAPLNLAGGTLLCVLGIASLRDKS